ncbi:CB1 cannabinoid receptor-interacting protein 1 isoform X3 [Lasiodiplodia theobromae]|uniref:CB1 cannabinoid receptor-interacting protein 1 isoform X3 n=1 Tax=Lasiodiplodia theobromae TaxID=45133 RepID=UPI0015C32B88|nr:CB1 cannabinoid receptor-interacting protein 1 isoform X3 [Lasiodiplodia theobromae]KAF4544346.1 CB1 cannabinoid receptor-interacting protein 1 isoform X3 [Lasiodiplodia theobromae]
MPNAGSFPAKLEGISFGDNRTIDPTVVKVSRSVLGTLASIFPPASSAAASSFEKTLHRPQDYRENDPQGRIIGEVTLDNEGRGPRRRGAWHLDAATVPGCLS